MSNITSIARLERCLITIDDIWERDKIGFDDRWITGMLRYWITMLIRSLVNDETIFHLHEVLTVHQKEKFVEFYIKHCEDGNFSDILQQMLKYELINIEDVEG